MVLVVSHLRQLFASDKTLGLTTWTLSQDRLGRFVPKRVAIYLQALPRLEPFFVLLTLALSIVGTVETILEKPHHELCAQQNSA
jgi:hypothetical protein